MVAYSFREDISQRRAAFIAMLVLVLLGIQLGFWQLRRAEYKDQLATELIQKEQLKPISANEKQWKLDQVQFHRMIADGQWIESEGVWLDNRPHPLGRDPKTGITTGLNLLMPLKIQVQQLTYIVWVNRGWAPRNFIQRDQVPEIPSNKNSIQVSGVAFANAGNTLKIADEDGSRASDGRLLLQNFSLEEASKKLNIPAQPFILRQEAISLNDGNQDSLDRHWQLPESGAARHRGYAIQWFALTGMTFLFWLITGIRKQSQRLR